MTTRHHTIAVLLGLTVFALACVSGMQYRFPELEQKIPPNLRDEYRMFTVNCSKCHDLARPLQARVTDVEHWDRYVGRMMRTPGSGISTQEAFAILRFLHWYTTDIVNGETATPASQESSVKIDPSNSMPQSPSNGNGPAPTQSVGGSGADAVEAQGEVAP